jgi:hypothetical protein
MLALFARLLISIVKAQAEEPFVSLPFALFSVKNADWPGLRSNKTVVTVLCKT